MAKLSNRPFFSHSLKADGMETVRLVSMRGVQKLSSKWTWVKGTSLIGVAYSQEFFKTFLSDPKNMENLKSEFFIPLMVDKLINDKTATVEVLDTASKWFGVTYPEDRQEVVDKIQALIDAGEYPAKLF